MGLLRKTDRYIGHCSLRTLCNNLPVHGCEDDTSQHISRALKNKLWVLGKYHGFNNVHLGCVRCCSTNGQLAMNKNPRELDIGIEVLTVVFCEGEQERDKTKTPISRAEADSGWRGREGAAMRIGEGNDVT